MWFFTLLISFALVSEGISTEKCRIVRNTMMSCLEAKDSDLPTKPQDKIEWLTFTKSSIPSIKKSFLKNFPKLTDFHAENAGIEIIEADAFSGLLNINWIDVAQNKLKEISPDLFRSSKQIEHFNISGNTDLAIPKNKPFLDAPSLRWLDLSSCNIREVNSETFSKLTTLRDLSLAHNLLKNLPEDVFKNNRGLLSLDITDNKIKTLSDKVFLNMRTMVVRLEDNPWNCDCHLSPLLLWSKRNVVKGDVRCEKPGNKRWKEIANPQKCL